MNEVADIVSPVDQVIAEFNYPAYPPKAFQVGLDKTDSHGSPSCCGTAQSGTLRLRRNLGERPYRRSPARLD
jgi:hypothetical protein